MSKVSPISAGIRGRCPNCGEGHVWQSYLKFKPQCEICGQEFDKSDTADGPAFFVGFFVLIVFAPFGFIIPMADQSMTWKILMMLGLLVFTSIVALFLLPIAKSLLMALQVANKAEEGRWEE